MIAAVDVKRFAGDKPGGIMCKKCGRDADVIDADKAARGGFGPGLIEQGVEAGAAISTANISPKARHMYSTTNPGQTAR